MYFSDFFSPNISISIAQVNWHSKACYEDQMQPKSESKSGGTGEQTVMSLLFTTG